MISTSQQADYRVIWASTYIGGHMFLCLTKFPLTHCLALVSDHAEAIAHAHKQPT